MNTTPRDHLVLVLDTDRLDDALGYAERMAPWFGIVKVGYELYASAGPEALESLRDQGFRVFADLKLHDIPTTVERGARAIGRRGVDFLNFHAAGGVAMLRAGVEGLREGAHDAGHVQPLALAVTVLTSDPEIDALVPRMDWAVEACCDGVVCAGTDVALARERGLRTTPRTIVRKSMSPFGLMAFCARAGRARWAGSLMTRSAAKGSPACAA